MLSNSLEENNRNVVGWSIIGIVITVVYALDVMAKYFVSHELLKDIMFCLAIIFVEYKVMIVKDSKLARYTLYAYAVVSVGDMILNSSLNGILFLVLIIGYMAVGRNRITFKDVVSVLLVFILACEVWSAVSLLEVLPIQVMMATCFKSLWVDIAFVLIVILYSLMDEETIHCSIKRIVLISGIAIQIICVVVLGICLWARARGNRSYLDVNELTDAVKVYILSEDEELALTYSVQGSCMVLAPFEYLDSQIFTLRRVCDGVGWRIVSANNCAFDVSEGNYEEKNPVIAWTDNDTVNQHWNFKQVESGAVSIVPEESSYVLALDKSGNTVLSEQSEDFFFLESADIEGVSFVEAIISTNRARVIAIYIMLCVAGMVAEGLFYNKLTKARNDGKISCS